MVALAARVQEGEQVLQMVAQAVMPVTPVVQVALAVAAVASVIATVQKVVAVVIQAEHLCMTMRGIKKPGSNLVTSANRGNFRSKPATRAEFLSLVQSR